MLSSNRINSLGLFCSCAAHAAIMGGFLLSGSYTPPRKLADRDSSAPLVVELLPLEQGNDSHESPRNLKRLDDQSRISDVENTQPVEIKDKLRAVVLLASSSSDVKSEAAAPQTDLGSEGAASYAELSDYQRRLYDAVARNSRYPADARLLNLSGITQLAFRIDRVGNVLESWVQESSGSELLDDAALEALARAQPLPPIPISLPSRMDFVIEIDSSIMQQQVASRSAR